MKLKELINELKQIEEEHGNLEVGIGYEGIWREALDVSVDNNVAIRDITSANLD